MLVFYLPFRLSGTFPRKRGKGFFVRDSILGNHQAACAGIAKRVFQARWLSQGCSSGA